MTRDTNANLGMPVVLMALTCLFVAGCLFDGTTDTSSGPGAPAPAGSGSKEAAPTHVIAADTSYYLSGPQQARPPEGTFPAGTRVTLLDDAGSYAFVRAENGVAAYVATGSLEELDK
jgi:hypothetical protein